MNNLIFGIIILIHFLADFSLQTNQQAQQKSISTNALFNHVGIYTTVWFLALIAINEIINFSLFDCLIFCLITFVAHSTTDYFTSRIGKPYWEEHDYHNGFTVVGFDQMLHFFQLYYTFKLLL